MVPLAEIIDYCDNRLRTREIRDFPGANNGLQVANRGMVTKIGAAVDAGRVPFEMAAAAGVNLVFVHHGMLWDKQQPVTGRFYDKLRVCFAADIAVYSSHLPLDAHPELGNNALLAKRLSLPPLQQAFAFEGQDIGLIAGAPSTRAELLERLQSAFPRVTALEFGSTAPRRVGIVSGGGGAAVNELRALGLDTLITGELAQWHFNQAQEEGFNLYACGHYDTETFGVCALAAEVAARYNLPWQFLPTGCPL